MDMDNFDFKPITKGLGFDKKADDTKTTPSAPRVKGKETTKTLKTGITPTPTNSLNFSDDRLLSKLDDLNLPIAKPKAPEKSRSEKLELESFKAENFKKEIKKDTPTLFEKPLDWDTSDPKTSKSLSEMLNALPPSIDFFDEEKALKQKETKVYKPIGRLDYNPGVAEIPATPETVESYKNTTDEKMDVSLDNTLEKAFPKVGFRRPFFHQAVEVQPQFTEISTSFTSAVLDALVIAGMTALLLVGLILLTGIDLIAVVMYSKASAGVWMELGAIFLGVYLLYYMVARGFWGSTLGDWAFDIHLGTPAERTNWNYPYQVLLRMAGIALTGFVLLPILSLITGKDVAQSYSKLRLYVKNY